MNREQAWCERHSPFLQYINVWLRYFFLLLFLPQCIMYNLQSNFTSHQKLVWYTVLLYNLIKCNLPMPKQHNHSYYIYIIMRSLPSNGAHGTQLHRGRVRRPSLRWGRDQTHLINKHFNRLCALQTSTTQTITRSGNFSLCGADGQHTAKTTMTCRFRVTRNMCTRTNASTFTIRGAKHRRRRRSSITITAAVAATNLRPLGSMNPRRQPTASVGVRHKRDENGENSKLCPVIGCVALGVFFFF